MKPLITGVFAGAGLLLLYGVTMGVLSGLDAAMEQFRALWYLMVPLVLGFGIQVGLYTRLRQKAAGMLTTGGTSAGVGMLACCAHHAADALPILGLSTLAAIIGQYQNQILIISIGMNVFGIIYLYRHIRRMT